MEETEAIMADLKAAREALARVEARVMQKRSSPEKMAGSGLWERFDPYRVQEYLQPLWEAWGPGHPAPSHWAAKQIAERLQRWMGGLDEERRQSAAEDLAAWAKESYTQDKVRLLLSGDWSQVGTSTPRTKEGRDGRIAQLTAQISQLDGEWSIASDAERERIAQKLGELRSELRRLKGA